jgi:hypothetical protein
VPLPRITMDRHGKIHATRDMLPKGTAAKIE